MWGKQGAVITLSGGAGIMCSDGLERRGLELAELSTMTVEELADLPPDWMPLGSPLGIWTAVMLHGARKAYLTILKAVLNDPNVDRIMCIVIAPLPEFSFLDVSVVLNNIMEELSLSSPLSPGFTDPKQ